MLILTALLVAAPNLITLATATRDDGQLEVAVHADGPLGSAQVGAKLEQHRLLLTIPDATLESSEKTFHELHRYLKARRLAGGGVELEVPIGNHVACTAPVTAETRPFGLELRVACRDTVAKADESAAIAGTAESAGGTASTSSAAPSTNTSAPATASAASQPAALSANQSAGPGATAVASTGTAPRSAALAVVPIAASASPTTAPAPLAVAQLAAPAPFLAAPAPALAAPAPAPLAALAEPARAPALDLAPGSTSGAGRAAGLAVLALCALGAAAIFFKRKGRPASNIQVLETIGLGPKRSLVLARVGTETLLLASSEAGVTLISTGATLSGLNDLAAAALREAPAQESEANWGAQFARGLAAYAPKKGPESKPDREPRQSRDDKSGPGLLGRLKLAALPEPRFDSLFAETAEDQDLRSKLAQGLSARVS